MPRVTAIESQTIYIVIQEGGSSCEAYASSYNTEDDARDAMRGHTNATYRSSGPHPVKMVAINGVPYIEEGDALELASLAKNEMGFGYYDDGIPWSGAGGPDDLDYEPQENEY